MSVVNQGIVDVFPISTSAFGFKADWFDHYVPMMMQPTYLLMVLLLVLSVGIMALKRFDNADLEKKLWNLPVIITIVMVWPALIHGIKDLVDTFNSFLVRDVFKITWKGFGFPDMGSITNFFGWSAESLARLLPNLSYWIIYAFYMVFFFFFAVLGPFVLAKGILFDEIEAFLEILKEITVLFLWQTTLVVLVAFIMPDIVSGKPFPPNPQANIYFLSLILGLMILFVPSMTRKFANHLGSSFFPPGLRWGGAVLALTGFGKVAGRGLATVGIPPSHRWNLWMHRVLTAAEFRKRYRHEQEVVELQYENAQLEHEVDKLKQQEYGSDQKHFEPDRDFRISSGDYRQQLSSGQEGFINLSKRARAELIRDFIK